MRTVVYLFFVLLAFSVSAQKKKNKKSLGQDSIKNSFIIQPNRIEFEIRTKDEDFILIPAEEKGLLVVKQTRVRDVQGYIWELTLIDSTLNVVWSNVLVVDYVESFLGYDYHGDEFYLLFGKSQYKLEEMHVVKIAISDGSKSHFDINTTFPIQLTEFVAIGNTLIFGGYAQFKPVVMLYNTVQSKSKVLPGFYNNNSEIVTISPDDENLTFTVIVNEKTAKKKLTITLKTFTENGELFYTKALDAEYEKTLLDGVSTVFDDGTQYVIGTYSRVKSEFSRGLYLSKLVYGEQQFIKYHNYADLDNFFSYMSAKREQRVKNRIERKKVRGKKVKFNYRLLVHEIIKRGDEYILIGEAYYPKYSSYGSTTNYNMPSSNQINPNFIGYRYTHAVVVGFNKNGEVLWDNSFEINDVLSLFLKQNVQVSVEKDKIVLLYVYENVIRSKIVKKQEILEGKSFDSIELAFKSDQIRDNNKDMEGLEKWYDGNFYAYGIQKIKNLTDQNVKLNRQVFYINKVQYK